MDEEEEEKEFKKSRHIEKVKSSILTIHYKRRTNEKITKKKLIYNI